MSGSSARYKPPLGPPYWQPCDATARASRLGAVQVRCKCGVGAAGAHQEARRLGVERLARREGDAQRVGRAVRARVVGDDAAARRVRNEGAVRVPVLLALPGALLEPRAGRRWPGWRRRPGRHAARWRWRRGRPGRARWHERARLVVQSPNVGREHRWTLPATELVGLSRAERGGERVRVALLFASAKTPGTRPARRTPTGTRGSRRLPRRRGSRHRTSASRFARKTARRRPRRRWAGRC